MKQLSLPGKLTAKDLCHGEVWRISTKVIFHRERIVKLIKITSEVITVSEVPYSPFTTDLVLDGVTFIEKIPQE